MFGRFIKGKKKDNFYLELKENDSPSVVDKLEAVATKVKQETQQIVEEVKHAATESSVIQDLQSETKETVKEIKTKVTEVAPKGKKASAKNEVTSSPVTARKVDTSYSDEPFWVKLMYKTSEQKLAEQNSEQTFATDYSISKPQPRRRPGGSLDPFKAMARQTKTKF